MPLEPDKTDVQYVGGSVVNTIKDVDFKASLQTEHIYGKYLVNEWNLNGFKTLKTPYNEVFKRNVLDCLYADFWLLSETHCKNDEIIEHESYLFYHHNRKESGKCIRGSGGVAIAVHKSLMESHKILGVYKGIDGQWC